MPRKWILYSCGCVETKWVAAESTTYKGRVAKSQQVTVEVAIRDIPPPPPSYTRKPRKGSVEPQVNPFVDIFLDGLLVPPLNTTAQEVPSAPIPDKFLKMENQQWEESGQCWICRRRKQAQYDAANNARQKMPVLTGSEAQILWAESLRCKSAKQLPRAIEYLETFREELIRRYPADTPYTGLAMGIPGIIPKYLPYPLDGLDELTGNWGVATTGVVAAKVAPKKPRKKPPQPKVESSHPWIQHCDAALTLYRSLLTCTKASQWIKHKESAACLKTAEEQACMVMPQNPVDLANESRGKSPSLQRKERLKFPEATRTPEIHPGTLRTPSETWDMGSLGWYWSYLQGYQLPSGLAVGFGYQGCILDIGQGRLHNHCDVGPSQYCGLNPHVSTRYALRGEFVSPEVWAADPEVMVKAADPEDHLRYL